jgi:hypothetical protein
MLKQLAVIFLFVSFMGQTFNKSILFMSYYANPAAFARNCINKARPMMHCNGKCQMMKKLQQEEQKEKENTERKADNKNELLSSRVFFEMPRPAGSCEVKRIFAYFIAKKPIGKARAYFHPPSIA